MKWIVVGTLALVAGCASKPEVTQVREAPPPPPLVHRVEWSGQTLEDIAGWYTGKKANWEKLAKPVNPDLERCCVPLRVGREVTIPSTLLVTVDPMPKPAPTKAKAPVAKAEKVTASKPEKAAAPKKAERAADEPADDEPIAERESVAKAEPEPEEPVAEAPAPGEKAGIGIAPVKPGSGPASGKVTLKGESWTVTDAIAYPDDDGEIHVSLTSKPFDRKQFAKDGKIDSFDVMRHGGMNSASSLTMKIGADGSMSCIDFSTQNGGGSMCNSAISGGFKVAKNTADSVAGSLEFKNDEDAADVRFDLPVTTKVERGGTKLPAGGGEPGAAVVANFQAIEAGDYEKSKALSHPEKRKMMEENEAESKEMFELMKAITPTDVKITGGLVDGDTATLDFTGKSDGQSVKGTIDVQRFEGKWYLESINTSQ